MNRKSLITNAAILAVMFASSCAAPPPATAPPDLHDALKAVNPQYDGRGKFTVESGKIVAADLSNTGVTDIRPLKGLPLESLALSSTGVSDLSPLKGMPLTQLQLMSARKLTDLSPLKGMPLTQLTLSASAVRDISPLRGMSLKSLRMLYVAAQDLAPLEGMPLVILSFSPKYVKKGVPAVRKIASLRMIATNAAEWTKRQTAAQFWKKYDAGSYGRPAMIAAVKPPVDKKKQLPEAVKPPEAEVPQGPFDTPEKLHAALKAVNPEYAGKGDFRTRDGKVVKVMLYGPKISDITPLKDLPLRTLNLPSTMVTDISVLKGMPLKFLYLKGSSVTDLSALKGMPLVSLGLQDTKVSDITPLRGLRLAGLYLDGTAVADIRPLQGMPLTALGISGTKVTALEPLAGMPLEKLLFTPENIKTGMDVIRDMQSLQVLANNDEEWRKHQTAADFWKKHDGVEVAQVEPEKKPPEVAEPPVKAPPEPPAPVKTELEGNWVGYDVSTCSPVSLTFTGDKVEQLGPDTGARWEHAFAANTAVNPRVGTLACTTGPVEKVVGKVFDILYKIENGKLTLASGGEPGVKPKDFTPVRGPRGVAVGICKRPAELDGVWTGTELGGKKGVKIIISGDYLEFRGSDPKEWYKGEAARRGGDPNQIDLTIRKCSVLTVIGKPCFAIYKIEGNTLTFAANEPGVAKRPTGFEHGTQTRVFVLTKEEAAAK